MAKKRPDATPAPRRRTTAPRRVSASTTAPAPAGIATAAGNGPTYDDIARAAYLRYLSRGGSDGQDFDDWVAAERELKNRNSGR